MWGRGIGERVMGLGHGPPHSLLSLYPPLWRGHYDPLSSHEIDGVRKEKERLTAVIEKGRERTFP